MAELVTQVSETRLAFQKDDKMKMYNNDLKKDFQINLEHTGSQTLSNGTREIGEENKENEGSLKVRAINLQVNKLRVYLCGGQGYNVYDTA